ncbi:MAG TPA: hypothetical protein VGM84_06375 [Steroidobacteraceae bacterium]|jgi:hypothetical protein
MKAIALAVLVALCPISAALAQAAPVKSAKAAAVAATPRLSPAEAAAWAQKNLEGWPKITIALATALLEKYGAPESNTPEQVNWSHNGPWNRTILYREGPQHNFPRPHRDILEQAVSYKVPPEKIADLVRYDGSLGVDRTRGELSVHCDTEEHNILTLNIADDIVKGERNVDQALTYHAQVIRGLETHDPQAYAEKLRFKLPKAAADTADPADEAALLRHLDAPE